jgi:hypothetical protein
MALWFIESKGFSEKSTCCNSLKKKNFLKNRIAVVHLKSFLKILLAEKRVAMNRGEGIGCVASGLAPKLRKAQLAATPFLQISALVLFYPVR